MKRRLCVLLALTLLFSVVSCGGQESDSSYSLYYLYQDTAEAAGGDAIAAEPCAAELSEVPLQAAKQLLELYLAGPSSENLKSPLPSLLQIMDVTLEETTLHVDVSSAYRLLSGIELSLADSCLMLTLTEIPGISRVNITVNGKNLDYRSHQTLQPRQVLLSTTEDVVEVISAMLWYADGSTAALSGEERKVLVYEGESRAEAVLAALLEGPETENLSELFPKGYSFRSAYVEKETCYIVIDSTRWPLGDEYDSTLALESAAKTVLSLQNIRHVTFVKDSKPFAEFDAS